MMLELPQRLENYGAVSIYELVRVLELDSSGHTRIKGAISINNDILEEYSANTAIVVPVKDEDLLTLEGVIAAIPHSSLVIIVSASSRRPVDRYLHELDLARTIHYTTYRGIVVVHQNDPVWRDALSNTPLEMMLEGTSVRKGKGEGMLLGVLIAAALGYKYVGFIDSDNYVPGAVLEYSKIYSAGFYMAESKYSMVRIKWPFKGKLASSDMYLRRRGRVSVITNSILNQALSRLRKVETDIIRTANSGEHALTIDLALNMKWAGGFAVEPYQFVTLLESCYIGLDENNCPITPDRIKIYQIESRNPHIHAERGDEHIADMIHRSLGVIYHSKLYSEDIGRDIDKIMSEYNLTSKPPAPRVYDPRGVDPSKVFTTLISNSRDAMYFESR